MILDSHSLQWWTAEPDRLSENAALAIGEAAQLAVAAITWFELAWLIAHDRINIGMPPRVWLEEVGKRVLTIGITPAIASTAVSLPSSFPRDPADRLIYATAIETGYHLVTKDRRMRDHAHPRAITIW